LKTKQVKEVAKTIKKILNKENMVVFGKYSDYYDLLYRDKDYQKRVQLFKKRSLKKYSSHKVKTILDLGCGTGNHSIILAEKGYQLTGIDFSPKNASNC